MKKPSEYQKLLNDEGFLVQLIEFHLLNGNEGEAFYVEYLKNAKRKERLEYLAGKH
ncbi:hypothetical protein GJU40_01685 [Bacillus lacus]|uniref:Uncharacterized protein n=1 Tax=Metabacillus lacus TaxID=1983721 RepID=A0A7X2IW40_9BACI|nr:hypothetical protein [Metabacillus lacus]MRX70878.1 hypothetical protein [Metabacillus lacus]